MDSLIQYPCFVGPSKINALVVPIGRWKSNDFINAVSKLKEFNEIRLLDITPIDSTLFNPQGFPNGRLFFNFNTLASNDEFDLFLYDFEPFRKTFILIGLVNDNSSPNENISILKEKYPTVISHNLIYCNESNESIIRGIDNPNVFFTNINRQDNKNLETIICDIGRDFLIALNHYYSSYKHVTLRSPGTIGGNAIVKPVLSRYGERPALINPTTKQSTSTSATTAASTSASSGASKRLSTFEITTNNLKRSASIKLTTTLTSSESKAQQRSKGRQLKILGNFQLLAGRYLDALNSFTEAIILLYKVRDLLWLGSALDGIAMSFILLSYLNITYSIPEIIDVVCPLNIQTTGASIGSYSNNNSSSSIPDENQVNEVPKAVTPRNSVSVTPLQVQTQSPRNSFVFTSGNNNTTVSNIQIEDINLPKLVTLISEKILYYYELSLSQSSEYVPQIVYSNTFLKILVFIVKCQRSQDQFSPNVIKDVISYSFDPAGLLKTIYNTKNKDPIQFTAGDVYYYVNRLFELNIQTMSVELQCIVYSTAANIYHSLGLYRKEAFLLRLLADSLTRSTQNITWHSDYENILDRIIEAYGCGISDTENMQLSHSGPKWLELQKSMLQLARDVSEKFNNLACTTKYSLLLLTKYTTVLSLEEQTKLLENIKKAIETKFITSYWDKAIIQSVTIKRKETSPTQASLLPLIVDIQNSKTALPDNKGQVSNSDEVYNPFKQVKSTSKMGGEPLYDTYLVNDEAEFSCTFQNPYKFPLLVTGLELPASLKEICELKNNNISENNPFIIKPQSSAISHIPIAFKKDTCNTIQSVDSVILSVFKMPTEELKVHNYGDNNFNFKILPEQPHLEIINTSKMTGNCIMMLDGTKMEFPFKLINKSLSCKISHLKFTTISNVERDLKPDYWQKLQPDELYSFDKQVEQLKKECITIHNAPRTLGPNVLHDFQLEVDLIKAPPNFTDFELIVEYGMKSLDGKLLFVKELRTQYEITIKRSLEISNLDIIPLNENITTHGSTVDWINFLQTTSQQNSTLRITDFALLLVDFRNSWIDGISLQTIFDDFISKAYLVEAQHTLRIIIPIRKLDAGCQALSDKPVPVLFKGRQFIQSGMSRSQERKMREKFWCSEYLLKHLKCEWKLSHDRSVTGSIDFRNYITKSECDIVPVLYKGSDPFVIQLAVQETTVKKGDICHVDVSLHPSSMNNEKNITGMVSINILIYDNKTSVLLSESNSRVLYNGSLSKLVPSYEETSSNFELLPIEQGEYRISVCISSGLDRNSIFQVDTSTVVITAV